MRPSRTIVLLMVALLLVCEHATVRSEPNSGQVHYVHALARANFTSMIKEHDMPTFVDFSSPECGHCLRLDIEWAKAAKILRGILPLAKVNCLEEMQLCDEHEVYSYPTIKMFAERGERVFTYGFEREAERIVKYAVGVLAPNSKLLQIGVMAHLRPFQAQRSYLPHVILFSEKPVPPLLHALSIRFQRAVVLGYVHKDWTNVVQHFHVDSFPTLAILNTDNTITPYHTQPRDRFELEELLVDISDLPRPDVYGRRESDNAKEEQDEKAEL